MGDVLDALVLSGGGAKGSFEVGAISFLYGRGLEPDLIVGTSVGAINGVKLAEGEGRDSAFPSGFEGLKKIWLELNSEADMYSLSAGVSELVKLFEGAVEKVEVATGVSFVVPIAPVLWYGLWEVQDDINTAIGEALRTRSIYTLAPIEERFTGGPTIDRQVDLECVEDSGIALLVGMVGLATGLLRYVDSHGDVFESDTTSRVRNVRVDLRDAVLASAAIPAIFEARDILGELQVDGGVREIAPVRAAVARGASRIYTIVAGAPPRHGGRFNTHLSRTTPNYLRHPGRGGRRSSPANIAEIALRGIELITEEVLSEDVAIDLKGATQHVVRPDFDVHETTVIDPGLIRISMGYGYMRAADVMSERLVVTDRRQRARELSSEISLLRRTAWELERNYSSTREGAERTSALGALVDVKCQIRQCIAQRIAIAGRDSVPEDSDQWWQGLEHHKRPFRFAPPARQRGPRGGRVERVDAATALSHAVQGCSPAVDQDDHRLFAVSQGSAFFIPSTYGGIGDFQLLVPQGPIVGHYRRANDEAGAPWEYLGAAYDSAPGRGPRGARALASADPGDWNESDDRSHWPAAVSFFQGSYGLPGNLEAIFSVASRPDESNAARGDRLFASWYNSHRRRWQGASEIQARFMSRTGDIVRAITGVTGPPAVIPSTYGGIGDFQLLVPQGPIVGHYRRANDEAGAPWEYLGAAYDSAPGRGPRGARALASADPGDWNESDDRSHWPAAVSFFQGSYGLPGNLEAIFSVASRPDESNAARGDRLFASWYNSHRRRWQGASEIQARFMSRTGDIVRAITGVTGPPAVIPSTYGGIGDFQLLVPQGPIVGHYRRANDEAGAPWEYLGAAYDSAPGRGPRGARALASADPGDWNESDDRSHWPAAVSFFQGSYGLPGNLEAIFSVASRPDESNAARGDRLFASWYNSHRRRWQGASEIQARFMSRTGDIVRAITGVTGPS